MIIAVDMYKVISLVIMAGFVATMAWLFIEWLLEGYREDNEPWIPPAPGDYDDRESWER